MRKLLMIAGAAAMAAAVPAAAKPGKGGGPGGGQGHQAGNGHGGGHGGGHGESPGGGHGNGGGHGGGGWKASEHGGGGWAGRELKAQRKFEKHEDKAERRWAKAERKRGQAWHKAEAKADRQWAKQERQFRKEDRSSRKMDRRFDDRPLFDQDRRLAGSFDGFCPPGLQKKNDGCLPPGQEKKRFRLGERIPSGYYSRYNLPGEYRDWYSDSPEYSYRYDDGYIYRLDNETNLVSALIPLLGGGFGVGSLLPAGFGTYNLPLQYRDDYQDNSDAYYRYGDDAIFEVDPKTNMIESVVALLAGDLNVGQALPSGYDTYNLPMNYRDQYQDSDEALYRYADGNIYEVDPKSRMIEAIVAQLI